MILINLLPHREAARKRSARRLLSPALGVAARRRRASIAGVWYLVVQQLRSRTSRQRNAFLQTEITQARSADQGHRHACRPRSPR